ncbi:MAG TPA: secondary thiamine-phosphate synthase enzyme YjbQ [Blastocatellia bacterium]|nr:secondary thiamine-phosphate synthase enzyme YjbQ [Blastocatellia bacterium]
MTVATHRDKQVMDITDRIEHVVAQSGMTEGLCNVFVAHTTAGLTMGEWIEGTDEDLMEALERMIPQLDFRHAHDPSHAPDHIISSLLGPSLTIPVVAGKLRIGVWQRVLLVECNGPRERDCIVTLLY